MLLSSKTCRVYDYLKKSFCQIINIINSCSITAAWTVKFINKGLKTNFCHLVDNISFDPQKLSYFCNIISIHRQVGLGVIVA